MKLKYVAFQTSYDATEIVVFSCSILHADIAASVCRIRDGKTRKPISAGFTNLEHFYGRSESMNLDSNNGHFQYLAGNSTQLNNS